MAIMDGYLEIIKGHTPHAHKISDNEVIQHYILYGVQQGKIW